MAVYGIGENKALIDISDELSGSDIDTASGARITFEAVRSHLPVEVTGSSMQTKTTGKQLFDFETWKRGAVGSRCSLSFAGSSVTITATDNDAFTGYNKDQFAQKIAVTPGKTYTLSWGVNGGYGKVYLFRNGDANISGHVNASNTAKKLSYTAKEGDQFITFRLGVQNTGDSCTYFSLMINEGSEPAEWEPYTGGQPAPSPEYPQMVYGVGHNSPLEINCAAEAGTNTLSIPLEKPLHGIGGVADTIEKNAAGKWGVMRRFETIVLDGSVDEAWGNGTNNVKVSNIIKSKAVAAADSDSLANIMANRFSSLSRNQIVNDRMAGANINPAGMLIVGHPDYLGDVELWKTYLAKNPLEVIYELARPVFEEFSEEIQKRFQHFRDGDGNNVVSASEVSVLADDFRAAGTAHDAIVEVGGKKYVRHKVEQVVFTGAESENWLTSLQNDKSTYRLYIPMPSIKPAGSLTEKGNISSNVYQNVVFNDIVTKNTKGISIKNTAHVIVYDPAFNTGDVALWKAHLAKNPLVVNYELLTPYDKPAVFNYPELKIQYAKTEQGALLLDLSAGIGSGSEVGNGEVTVDRDNKNISIGTDVDFGSGTDNFVMGVDAHVPADCVMSMMMGTEAGYRNSGTRNVAIGTKALRGKDDVENTASRNIAIGLSAGRDQTTGGYNVNIGCYSGEQASGGQHNVAVGSDTMKYATGSYNTAIGGKALNRVTTGEQNVAVGDSAGKEITTGGWNTAVGSNALANLMDQNGCVAVGSFAGNKNTKRYLVAIGNNAAYQTEGEGNTVVGADAMRNVPIGENNIAIGKYALKDADRAELNIAIGIAALQNYKYNDQGNSGSLNICIGSYSGYYMSGKNNVAIGSNTLYGANSTKGGNDNTAIGHDAMKTSYQYNNCVALGNLTEVTGDNQIQLGKSGSTPYAYAALQLRSDARDKADIRDTELGLEFINALRPVQFRWDLREDYDWGEKDGSKKRVRMHNGLIAQEVKETMDRLGVDFAGYQDHKINGGKDVLSIGYEELIAPLIKAIQELTERVQELENELQSK